MMANKVACSLLIPNLLASLSSGCAFFAKNWTFICESSDALTIFSMSSNVVDFSFMMLLFCRFRRQNKSKTLPFSSRVGVVLKKRRNLCTQNALLLFHFIYEAHTTKNCVNQVVPNTNVVIVFSKYFNGGIFNVNIIDLGRINFL